MSGLRTHNGGRLLGSPVVGLAGQVGRSVLQSVVNSLRDLPILPTLPNLNAVAMLGHLLEPMSARELNLLDSCRCRMLRPNRSVCCFGAVRTVVCRSQRLVAVAHDQVCSNTSSGPSE